VYTFTVKDNPLGSWADISTMIYVDQPIGTGFSYSDPETYLTSMSAAADEFITFM
jgi:carboxypeptidase D